MLTLVTVVAGAVDTFDQASYKRALSALLDGVAPSDIVLAVSAASVRVTATIVAPSFEVSDAALATLSALSSQELSSALSVQISSIESLTVDASGSHTLVGGPSSGDSGTMIIGIVAVVVVVLGAGGIVVRRRRLIKHSSSASIIGKPSISMRDIHVDAGGLPRTCHSPTASASNCEGNAFSTESGASPSIAVIRDSRRKHLAAKDTAQMQRWEWQSASITWRGQLGHGSFGSVYEVECGDIKLAAKRMDLSNSEAVDVDELLRREFRALSHLSHHNIVQLIGVVIDHPEWVALLVELADRGSLRHMLDVSSEEVVDQPTVQMSLALDMASGLAYLHGLGYLRTALGVEPWQARYPSTSHSALTCVPSHTRR